MSEIITIPVAQASANSDIVELLQTQLTQLQQMVNQFREQPPTPAAFCELENRIQSCLREAGRRLLEWLLVQLEPAIRDQTSPRVQFERETYRRRPKQPKTIYSTGCNCVSYTEKPLFYKENTWFLEFLMPKLAINGFP